VNAVKLIIAAVLVAINAFFVIAEYALVRSRRARLEVMAEEGAKGARLALDQIVRDVNDAGYPPPTYAGTDPTKFASTPFAWSPNYTVPTTCTIDGSCITPGDFDIIIETNPTPQDPTSQVQWIRYQLQGTTLMRGAALKQPGNDPAIDTAAFLAPLVQNVVNNSSAAQIAQYQAAYPGMFPTGNPVPIFSYSCDTGNVPLACTAAGIDNSPANIRDVVVTLIVATALPDATTGEPRIVQLVGRGRRINPNQ